MDINIDLELLYFLDLYLVNGKEKFNQLSNVVSSLEINSSELSTIGNLSLVKSSVSGLKNTYIAKSARINDVKQTFYDNDEAAHRLFNYLDGNLDEVFGNYTDENGFNYVLNVSDLVDMYINGGLKKLKGEKAAWNMYYYDEYTTINENGEIVFDGERYTNDLLEYIQKNYSRREAAVNSALVILQLAADRGVKYDYENKGTIGSGENRPEIVIKDVLSGVACNGFTSWVIAQGCEERFPWLSCEALRNDDPNLWDGFISGPRIESSEALPGDIFINELPSRGGGAHVGIIIENNKESETFVIAEASGENEGIIIHEISYRDLENSGFHVRNMEKFYN